MIVIRFTILGFLLLTSSLVQGQEIKFSVRVVEQDTNKKLVGVSVSAFLDTNLFQLKTTDSLGVVDLNLPVEKEYKIVISEPNMVTRFFIVDLTNCSPEQVMMYPEFSSSCEVKLFNEKDGVDYTYIINNPITRFYQGGGRTYLDFDSKMAMKMAKEIEQILSAH